MFETLVRSRSCNDEISRTYWEKNRKTFFRFFEFRLGIDFFHFRLRRFEKVESRLGSPEAGVEIGTG